ncbi:hypothetical protein CQA49_08040 [Helicobacter sp. MIT 00-7814]|uniref:type II toxin-antitoxin system HicA family toxin n=1 Tax=unclassified Helicobacter TaxID=2593540 RepID=UPI000E1E34D6|nr:MULTISPECIES: type II toxin-antitoxin system HicA family toxin [unclassified Helicobacter]RDU51876.1 hypothetical protein CQA37_09190 [Helicobacter sp. MIT 99-10781]RDU52555.1 hypothetical protein CQA49_08040 [Helicobacter sp. MIT 00-7814]
MSKKDKLLAKLENNPTNVAFEVLEKLLKDCGYEVFKSGGSHAVFRKSQCEILTIPYKRPVKVVYVKMVLKVLKEQK